jgi:hypothetical protein
MVLLAPELERFGLLNPDFVKMKAETCYYARLNDKRQAQFAIQYGDVSLSFLLFFFFFFFAIQFVVFAFPLLSIDPHRKTLSFYLTSRLPGQDIQVSACGACLCRVCGGGGASLVALTISAHLVLFFAIRDIVLTQGVKWAEQQHQKTTGFLLDLNTVPAPIKKLSVCGRFHPFLLCSVNSSHHPPPSSSIKRTKNQTNNRTYTGSQMHLCAHKQDYIVALNQGIDFQPQLT